MNKKTVSWAASVMMAGALAVAPFAGAQGYGNGMGGGDMMGGEERDMFDFEDMGIDMDRVWMAAANKNVLPSVCQPQSTEIKLGDEEAIMDCEEALGQKVIELIGENKKLTGQQISDRLGIGKALKAGGVSQAKRLRAVTQVKVIGLEEQDATEMVESVEQEHEANIAQRQEMRKQDASARQNMMGQMGSNQAPGGKGNSMMGDTGSYAGAGYPGANSQGSPTGGFGGNSQMSGVMNFGQGSSAKSPEDAARIAREMFKGDPKDFTPLMEQQAKDGFAMMQLGNGSNTAGAWQSGGANQQGQRQQGALGQGGQGGYGPYAQVTPGGQNRGPQGGAPFGNSGVFGQNFAGGSGSFTPPPGGQVLPQGGVPSGQPTPPPQGGVLPASAINTLGMGFWRGFFNFLGF